jgi:hypothetical protein
MLHLIVRTAKKKNFKQLIKLGSGALLTPPDQPPGVPASGLEAGMTAAADKTEKKGEREWRMSA